MPTRLRSFRGTPVRYSGKVYMSTSLCGKRRHFRPEAIVPIKPPARSLVRQGAARWSTALGRGRHVRCRQRIKRRGGIPSRFPARPAASRSTSPLPKGVALHWKIRSRPNGVKPARLRVPIGRPPVNHTPHLPGETRPKLGSGGGAASLSRSRGQRRGPWPNASGRRR
jgi:hypothetical protein